MKITFKHHKAIIYLSIVFAIILLALIGWYLSGYISNYQILSNLKNNQTLTYDQAMQDPNIAAVNQLFELPKQDVTLGYVQNSKSLQGRADYLKNAQNDNLVLIYPEYTIVYDPINKVIISIGKDQLLK